MDAMDVDQLFPLMSQELMRGVDQYVEAQNRFLEAWQDSVKESTDDELITSGTTGLVEAYEVWLDASREWTEQLFAVTEGEELDPRAIRDVWLRAANESSQALMGTRAFARMTGERVRDGLELQRQRDEATQAALESMGVATAHSMEEVGERLVELERRQHRVEGKLDDLLDHLESS